VDLNYKLQKYEKLTQELKAAKKKRSIDWFKPYGWQNEFIASSLTCKQITLLAANRVGKTECACAMLSYHLTGEYPDDYVGYRFTHPITALASGITGDQIRDVLQSKLIGDMEFKTNTFEGGGLIPTERIGDFMMSTGTKGLLKEARIKHKKGWSKLMFRSYEQGPAIIRGQSLDWILIDEEPQYKAMEFYGECLARTATANKGKGGFVCLTFTPENGITELVDLILNHRQEGQYVATVGWDRAPHLNEETKEQLLAAIPHYMVSAKTKGIPNFGESQVYKNTEEQIACTPFKIPKHFRVICGVDFGIAHPFAAVFIAHDVDRDILYLYDAFKVKDQVPAQHAHTINSKCENIRIVYPHDANSRDKGSGETLRSYYETAGANMYRMYENLDGTNFVEPGIVELQTRMDEGRFKVFSTLLEWWEEFRRFHRNAKNGKIVKEHDDLMDATRYAAIMAPRFAEQLNQIGKSVLETYHPTWDY
jgi:phage terminase large subunit-like protein